MWAAYIFAAIGIGSLAGVLTGNATLGLVCGALSSYFLQLVLLPLLMVGQNLEAREADKRAKRDDAILCRIDAIVEHHGIQDKVTEKEALLA